MRILQVCSARDIGGGEKHLADLANALSTRGHEIFVALAPRASVRGLLSSVPAENIIELPIRGALSLRSALKLADFASEQRIGIIHAHLGRDYPVAALAAWRAGAQLVLTRHVLFPLSKLHRLTLRRTARVIAVSEAVAGGLQAQNIFASGQIETIHNGVDMTRFDHEGKRQADPHHQRLRIGTIGHLGTIKGHEDFVRAAAIVSKRYDNVEFIIAGKDKSRNNENRAGIEKLIKGLGLEDRVHLTGWIDNVAQLLSSFDLFVSAARAEPFGLAIVEAMAAGVPLIATASEGAREIVNQNHSGRLVPVGNVESMAKAMIELLSDPEESERLARNAKADARTKFSLVTMVDKTERLYRNALSSYTVREGEYVLREDME